MGAAGRGGWRALALVVALALGWPPAASAAPSRQPAPCRFVLGFAELRQAVGPALVGECLEDERHDPATGDTVQRTTGGLLVWRKADNVTAFTDGHRSWVNGPFGLQSRLNAERFAWEAAPRPGPRMAPPSPDLAIVFLAGYGGPAETASPFGALEAELVARGWPRDAFLPFGYAGGVLADGRWRPHPYGCAATAAPLAHATAALAQLTATYARAHPRTRFVLVGHSLGGLVAWSYLAALRAGRAPAAALAGVVTVGAPLRGVGPDKRLAAVLGGCGGPVLDELGALHADADRLGASGAELAAWAGDRGIRVVTIGNDLDCLYAPRLPGCGVPFAAALGSSDDRESQFVPGTAVRLAVPVDPGWPLAGPLGRIPSAHLALLAPPAVGRVAGHVDQAAGR